MVQAARGSPPVCIFVESEKQYGIEAVKVQRRVIAGVKVPGKKRFRRVSVPHESAIRATMGILRLEHRDIVVIGASAGGLAAVSEILRAMPHDVDAAILVVLHTANHTGSWLPQIFERAGELTVCHPADGDPIERDGCTSLPPGST
jgi:chemotaxis response regulator CheB